ncbi:plasmid partitioning protein RepB C-terminal domain-containing protein [Geobacter benzoatilyticus]|uniref:ParB N-terminal domain-containing protein n=1 Tax=Geobacter benzoatilyticus TaxID=2815309 RepID=A0ABX7Q249_9BACT|nr:plasmid partitioning protein RepB C-terminal domain-containing protein [Geobacter benzoatilyticus]QSV44988.1 ParB N-terminal domain-containing protein [Geobacter benzoatilyticus]
MANIIKQGFQEKLIELAVEELLTTKSISIYAMKCRKYGQVLSSIREVGLIEAPVVAPIKKGKGYLLLDGHLRIMALKELGVERVSCLISTDDETYTYNKYINRLSAIQEHRMIMKAIQSGVSEEKLARALNLDISTIRNKKCLLEGICPEAVDLLKDKVVPEPVFRVLKKMKAPRQINAAMLMNDQNKFTSSYAKALLDATPANQLVNKGKPKKETPAILARQVRLEEESLALSMEIGSLKEQYGTAMIDMTSMQAYLKSMLGNEAVAKYLREFHGPIHDKFKQIAELDFFRLKNME